MTDEELIFKHDKKGHIISPELPPGKKNFLIDIDGTICEDIPNEEAHRMENADIYPGALEYVNSIYQLGHHVYFFTSRTEELRKITTVWLDRNGFKYHGIIMGKPRGGNYHWIDNHQVTFNLYEGRFPDLEKTIQNSIPS